MANAPPPVPPVELDDQARELLAAARAAKTAMGDAIERYEQAVWQAAWDRGHQQGWREGHAYALWKLEQARAQVFAPTVTQTPPRSEPPAPIPIEEESDDGPSAQDIVLGIVTARPGLRGKDIVTATETAGTAVKERTVRTALHRLKRDGAIVNVDERWYVPGDAPSISIKDLL